MIQQHASYRAYLRSVLADKTASNPSFSMNVWAKKIGIAQGFLSEVLSGKKNLSQEGCLKIAANLQLTSSETEYFSLLVQIETTKDPAVKERLLDRLNAVNKKHPVHNLEVDFFRSISDWYCAAMLEMTFLEGFEYTPRNVARRLGISVIEAESALERLMRLELIEKSGDGKFTKTKGYLFAESAVSHQAIIGFHRQLMEKAIANLTLSPTERKGRSEVIPISPEIMPEVERILDDASEKIRAAARKNRKKREVYGLSLHFFPLTKKGK